jgi:hypothetical protein
MVELYNIMPESVVLWRSEHEGLESQTLMDTKISVYKMTGTKSRKHAMLAPQRKILEL